MAQGTSRGTGVSQEILDRIDADVDRAKSEIGAIAQQAVIGNETSDVRPEHPASVGHQSRRRL
jgi:hypothetical protein